ncbi:MAG: DUF2461 domain-containing protein [Acidimicrobiales bacterium]
MATKYFTPELFKFLNELKDNNDRVWFKANQQRFEDVVRQPALDFITDFAGPLAGISDHFVADSRTVGGSLFRIQRDTRFAKDKTPYKLNTGMHFRHERAKDAHAPGFYLHLAPGACFVGVGLWRPESKVAYKIRDHIGENPEQWKKATRSKKFSERFELGGDSLKRPPKGFDPDHPLIDDLKRKDFMATCNLTQGQITNAKLMPSFEEHCKRAVPLMRFLCEAVGVDF